MGNFIESGKIADERAQGNEVPVGEHAKDVIGSGPPLPPYRAGGHYPTKAGENAVAGGERRFWLRRACRSAAARSPIASNRESLG